MKKKINIIIGILVPLLIIIVGIIITIIFNSSKRDKDTYTMIKIDKYKFEINDKYEYEFDKKEDYGTFKNSDFLTSYIYISERNYPSLISKTSTYTNMSSNEIDSSIEEMKFGKYDGFINMKKVNYYDVDKDYDLVIILIKIEEKRTLVVQYEKEANDENESILEDIKNGLSKIEEDIR